MIIQDRFRINRPETAVNRDLTIRIKLPDNVFTPLKRQEDIALYPVLLQEMDRIYGVFRRVNYDVEVGLNVLTGCEKQLVSDEDT